MLDEYDLVWNAGAAATSRDAFEKASTRNGAVLRPLGCVRADAVRYSDVRSQPLRAQR